MPQETKANVFPEYVKALDKEYAKAIEGTLTEWLSKEDDEAEKGYPSRWEKVSFLRHDLAPHSVWISATQPGGPKRPRL